MVQTEYGWLACLVFKGVSDSLEFIINPVIKPFIDH